MARHPSKVGMYSCRTAGARSSVRRAHIGSAASARIESRRRKLSAVQISNTPELVNHTVQVAAVIEVIAIRPGKATASSTPAMAAYATAYPALTIGYFPETLNTSVWY